MMTNFVYHQWSSGICYEVHRYWVSSYCKDRLKVIRKYFRVMDRDEVPLRFKRRKTCLEYAETALMILARIEQLCILNVPLALGSKYIHSEAWAVVGEPPEPVKQKAGWPLLFCDFVDLLVHYRPLIIRGGSCPEMFHFRLVPYLSVRLAAKYNCTPSYIVSVALLLVDDLINFCGPDCPEVYDLFTNDIRVNTVDIEAWQDLRCKVWGRHGHIKKKPYNYKVGQLCTPHIPLESTVKFELIKSKSLTDGVKGKRVKYHPYTEEELAAMAARQHYWRANMGICM